MSLDPAEGKWVLFSETPQSRVWHLRMSDGLTVVKTEHLLVEQTMEEAAIERSANAGKRWGEGQVIGRVPMGLYFSSGLAEARRQRDDKFIKRFWNDGDHKRLRTFEGDI